MNTMTSDPSPAVDRGGLLAEVALRTGLARFVRSRVPVSEVDDIVQATLIEALASDRAPEDAKQLYRWVYGIARHKCVDFYRRRGREAPAPEPVDGDVPTEGEPLGARDLLRWAEKELPPTEHAENTLEWMLREASGDKLETIADEEQVPAPRVRQRVARMRQHYRSRWAAQVAAIVAGVLLVVAAIAVWRHLRSAEPVAEEIRPERLRPDERAAELRREAFSDCDEQRWNDCLQGLDEAAQLDPAGDTTERVGQARRAAGTALQQKEQQLAPPAPEPKNETQPQPPAPNQPLPNKPLPNKSKGKQPEKKMAPPKGEPELTQNAAPQSNRLEQQQLANLVRDSKAPAPQKAFPSAPKHRGKVKASPPATPLHQSADFGDFDK